MDEISLTRLWLMRIAFVLICLFVLFFRLLPLEFTPRRLAGPDLMLAFAFAWVLRRPEYVPVWIVAGLFLLADLLLGRPPGLFAATSLLAFEHLRARAPGLRDMPFTVEWVTVAMAMGFAVLAYRLVLAVTLVEIPSFHLAVISLAATIALYPAVVLVTRFGFGLRKVALGEVNALGQRQ